ncbi:MAG: succinyl-diaminopimelate desuccinylase [Acidimicrobiales bacterium]|nr:succinyl-diaminopimelate desuccinylase [Acidimicrobiales bacterium]
MGIPSESHDERQIADHLEAELRAAPWLRVERVGDNVVARTELGRSSRLVLAGHTDTVPANGNQAAILDGDTLHGLGASDMKSGLAVFLELARTVAEPVADVTYVFYAGEEVDSKFNGLGHLFEHRPELLAGDVAILGEPTDGWIEAGCQGTMRFEVTLVGVRAHTARPWMGVNAVHRLARLLDVLDGYQARTPLIDGCEFHEALQAVRVEGGVANNVVPDRATVTINHRVAPDRTLAEAEAHVRDVLARALDGGDELRVVAADPPALPGLTRPLLQSLVERSGLPVRAKLGWTDVARFSEHGIPAVNLGPGDPNLAHTAEERVVRSKLDDVHAALLDLLTTQP